MKLKCLAFCCKKCILTEGGTDKNDHGQNLPDKRPPYNPPEQKPLRTTGRLPTIYILNHQISLLTLNRSVDSAVRPLMCSRVYTPCIGIHHMVSPECRMSSEPTSETQ